MEIRCHTPGVRVMQLWACAVLALLAVLLFWQWWWLAALFWAAASLAACLGLQGWANSILLTLSGAELRLEGGSWLRVVRRQPVWSLSSVLLVQTPLLRRADACILLLYSTHSVWLVPAVQLDQAQQLSLLPGQGGKHL